MHCWFSLFPKDLICMGNHFYFWSYHISTLRLTSKDRQWSTFFCLFEILNQDCTIEESLTSDVAYFVLCISDAREITLGFFGGVHVAHALINIVFCLLFFRIFVTAIYSVSPILLAFCLNSKCSNIFLVPSASLLFWSPMLSLFL